MALPQEQFEIDGHSYQVTALDAVAGRKTYLRVLKAVSPALAAVAGSEEKDQERLLVKALVEVFQGLDVQLFDDLCSQMAGQTVLTNDGKKLPLDSVFGLHFAGRYKALTQWLLKCLQVNKFFDFLPANVDLEKLGSASK